MMNKILILAMAPMLLVFTSCKKDNDGAKNIVINYTKPVVGDTIQSWNQIHIEGTITAEGEMSGYHVSIVNKATGTLLFETKYDVKAPAYNFHEHWLNNVHDTTTVQVRVEGGSKNVNNNQIKTVDVVCLP